MTGTADLVEQTLSQQRDSAFHRLLKYNAEFNDYIDDDGDDEAMKHLDRYQIIFKEADQNEVLFAHKISSVTLFFVGCNGMELSILHFSLLTFCVSHGTTLNVFYLILIV